MISVKNPTTCTMLLVMLCHASLVYSQHPAMSNATADDSWHLIRVIYKGNTASLDSYIKQGGDLNKRLSVGKTLLECAHKSKQDKVIAWLIEHGAKPSNEVPKLENSEQLLKPRVHIEPGELNKVTLGKGEIKRMKFLLFHGANPNNRGFSATFPPKVFSSQPATDVVLHNVTLLGYLISRLAVIDYNSQQVDEVVEKAQLLIGYEADIKGCSEVLEETERAVNLQASNFFDWEDSKGKPNYNQVVEEYRTAYLRYEKDFTSEMLWNHCRHGSLRLADPSNHYFQWLASFPSQIIPNPDIEGGFDIDVGSWAGFRYFLKDYTTYLAKKAGAIKTIRDYPRMLPMLITATITQYLTKDPTTIVEQYMKES